MKSNENGAFFVACPFIRVKIDLKEFETAFFSKNWKNVEFDSPYLTINHEMSHYFQGLGSSYCYHLKELIYSRSICLEKVLTELNQLFPKIKLKLPFKNNIINLLSNKDLPQSLIKLLIKYIYYEIEINMRFGVDPLPDFRKSLLQYYYQLEGAKDEFEFFQYFDKKNGKENDQIYRLLSNSYHDLFEARYLNDQELKEYGFSAILFNDILKNLIENLSPQAVIEGYARLSEMLTIIVSGPEVIKDNPKIYDYQDDFEFNKKKKEYFFSIIDNLNYQQLKKLEQNSKYFFKKNRLIYGYTNKFLFHHFGERLHNEIKLSLTIISLSIYELALMLPCEIDFKNEPPLSALKFKEYTKSDFCEHTIQGRFLSVVTYFLKNIPSVHQMFYEECNANFYNFLDSICKKLNWKQTYSETIEILIEYNKQLLLNKNSYLYVKDNKINPIFHFNFVSDHILKYKQKYMYLGTPICEQIKLLLIKPNCPFIAICDDGVFYWPKKKRWNELINFQSQAIGRYFSNDELSLFILVSILDLDIIDCDNLRRTKDYFGLILPNEHYYYFWWILKSKKILRNFDHEYDKRVKFLYFMEKIVKNTHIVRKIVIVFYFVELFMKKIIQRKDDFIIYIRRKIYK